MIFIVTVKFMSHVHSHVDGTQTSLGGQSGPTSGGSSPHLNSSSEQVVGITQCSHSFSQISVQLNILTSSVFHCLSCVDNRHSTHAENSANANIRFLICTQFPKNINI